MRSTSVAIEAKELTKRFDGFTAVDSIDFEVHDGEAFGFLGPNGAGKTSTIKMITCTSPLSGGRLEVKGMNVVTHSREIKMMLGIVPQENNLDPDFTALENLLVYARYYNIAKEEASKRAEELLEFFLGDVVSDYGVCGSLGLVAFLEVFDLRCVVDSVWGVCPVELYELVSDEFVDVQSEHRCVELLVGQAGLETLLSISE